jgi:SAM-dependent methyltransferase
MATIPYPGQELELFALARNWKAYWADLVRPWLHGHVLEVGSGLGVNAGYLMRDAIRQWTALEPDPTLFSSTRKNAEILGRKVKPRLGTIADIAVEEFFDAILYADVLEHIEDDLGEMRRAAGHLNVGGRVIVLSPAHQSLMSEFDCAIGHFRRYDAEGLRAITPPGMRLEFLWHLDSVGWFASLGNRLFLRQALPSPRAISFWDRWLVPMSRRLDPILGRRFGKTVLAVYCAA